MAQDLVKEINVDRTIVPEQRAAVRPLVFPSLVMPTVGNVDLSMQENTDKAQLPPLVAPFDAARTEPSFPMTPWRGYVDAGYFPSADFGISAGYSLINKPSTQLGVWGQFNHISYMENKEADFRYKTTDLTLGVDLAQKFGKFNTLRLSTDFGYSKWTNPYPDYIGIRSIYEEESWLYDHRKNIRWHLRGSFDGRIDSSFTYGVTLGGGIFNNLADNSKPKIAANNAPEDVELVKQSNVDFGIWFRGNVTEKAILGVKAEGKFLHFNSFLTPTMMLTEFPDINATPGKTLGMVDIVPSAEFNGGGFYGKIGARFGFAVNSGKTLHVAPEAMLCVNPDDRFGAWLKFGGGLHANSLEEMMRTSRYADPRTACDLSNVAVTGQLGLRIGPFRGATLSLTLDYASAKNWLMPIQFHEEISYFATTASTPLDANTFLPVDLSTWKFGARFDWSFRRALSLALSYDATLGNGAKHSWLYWADRARQVAGAEVTLHPGEFAEAFAPVKPLSIDVAFTARIDRSQSIITSAEFPTSTTLTASYSLGDVVNLAAGASWHINSRVTVFARFHNLLGRYDRTIYSIPTQGFSGLFGVTYKF